MIRQWKHIKVWRADYFFQGRKITSVAHHKHEAWANLIEIVAIEAKN
jgi:hypothetical protein